MRFGVGLRVRYEAMADLTRTAEQLGYESVWIPEHLIFPANLGSGGPGAGDAHPPVDPSIPTFDNLMVLLSLAVATNRIRLGTWVYNLALRHPIAAARAVQTLDHLSGGRVTLGVGAGWVAGEYAAVGVDFATRGRRLDESIDVLRLLWSEDEPSHAGRFFAFGPVKFEPKPLQTPVPIHVGGESAAALRRAAVRGDGWLGMGHDPDSAARQVRALRRLIAEAGRDPEEIEVSVGATPRDRMDVEAFARAGVDRLIVSPWGRTAGAVEGLRAFASTVLGGPSKRSSR